MTALAFLPGCGSGPAEGGKAADQRVEEMKTDIMTQMDRNKDFHIRNKDKLKDGPPMLGSPVGYGSGMPSTGAATTDGAATNTPAVPPGASPTGAAPTPPK